MIVALIAIGFCLIGIIIGLALGRWDWSVEKFEQLVYSPVTYVPVDSEPFDTEYPGTETD
jgi:hypothetical protein